MGKAELTFFSHSVCVLKQFYIYLNTVFVSSRMRNSHSLVESDCSETEEVRS